jgi:predicted nuclease with TOPRIM domain
VIEQLQNRGHSPNQFKRVSPQKQDQFEMMKQEKQQLNNKLDEFSYLMKELQANQKNFEQENQALKMKISQMEEKNGVSPLKNKYKETSSFNNTQ